MDPFLTSTALLLVGASALGGLLPLTRRWSERGLHLFVAVSAGIFLGTIFFHLLPHMAGVHDHDHGDGHGAAAGAAELSVWPFGAALLGFLLLFALEKIWLPKRTSGHPLNPHAVLWSATYLGLALHALTAGVALVGVLEHPDARTQFLASVLVHKATECFSLATVMRLGGLRTGRAVLLLALFALIEPTGLLLGGGLASLHPAIAPILTGFAIGTFLYVAVCDLLPEVFHGAGSARTKLLAVVAGTLLTGLNLGRLERLGAFALDAAREAWSVTQAMAPFLLFGFLLAGVLHVVLRTRAIARRMGGDDARSVGWATLVGAPLPLCSCSVVPVAVSLRKAGASKGAASAFTVATPETGVDSIAVTWALLDPFLTVARPVGALISAFAAGSAVNWLVRRGLDRDASPAPAPAPAAQPGGAACCDDEAGCTAPEADGPQGARVEAAHAHAAAPVRRGPFARAVRFALLELPDDLASSLLLGIVLSGAIAAGIPDGWLSGTAVAGAAGLFLALLFGLPVYVCAAASTPIAAAMILKGMSPGAAFVFLLAGPATNTAALIVLARHLGRRVVLVQASVIAVVALFLGWIVDRVYAGGGLAPAAVIGHGHDLLPPWTGTACAVLLLSLLTAALVRTRGTRDLLAPLREGPEPARG